MRFHPFLFVAIAAGSACSDDGHDHEHIDAAIGDGSIDGPEAPRTTVTRSFSMNAGASREGEVALVAVGDHVRVRATADASTLAWNVHTHNSGGTQILEEHSGVAAIDFQIEGAIGDYWLLLVNGSGTLAVTVNFDLYGQAQYTGGL